MVEETTLGTEGATIGRAQLLARLDSVVHGVIARWDLDSEREEL
jgi:hypothetical protein